MLFINGQLISNVQVIISHPLKLVQRAQQTMPGKPRKLFLDIEGHRNREGGFDADMIELLTVFLPDVLAPFLSEIYCSLFRTGDRKQQENELPLELIIK